MVYKVKEMNLNETFESPMSPAEANEHGNMERINVEGGILMELIKCLRDDLVDENDLIVVADDDVIVMVGFVAGLLVVISSTSGLNFGLQYKTAVESKNKQN